jgi:hypothetical protein
MGEMRLRKSLVGKPEGKGQAGRRRRKWKGNKVVLKKLRRDCVDCAYLSQDNVKWQGPMTIII